MILKKLASAIRRQDWFQVMIEVLIVIVGIFLGLQVQNWYEERGNRDQEAKYLEQLHDEVAEIEQRYERSMLIVDERVDILQHILTKYNEKGTFDEFSHSECNVLLVSHLYTNFISPITTINELETSGRSQIIQNSEIRNLMVQHKMNEDFSDKFTSNLQARGIEFPVKYPEFIELGKAITISSGLELASDVGNRCKVPTAEKNIDFKNSLVANEGRYAAYNRTAKRQFESLSELHIALDQELGIDHREDGI